MQCIQIIKSKKYSQLQIVKDLPQIKSSRHVHVNMSKYLQHQQQEDAVWSRMFYVSVASPEFDGSQFECFGIQICIISFPVASFNFKLRLSLNYFTSYIMHTS